MAELVDSTVGSLPAAPTLNDASLLVIEQQGEAMHITGAQIKGYAQDAVSGYVGQAQAAVEEAQQASQQALEAVGQIGTSVQDAQQAAQQAQTSSKSAQDSAAAAEAARDQYPRPENGEWMVYNPSTGEFENSGAPSVGPEGPEGPAGATGASVASLKLVSGNHAPGTYDTYQIVLSNSEIAGEFQVYNGANGSGAGDMLKSVYDPDGLNTNIFAYAVDQVSQHNTSPDAHQDIRELIPTTAAQVGADPAGSAAQALTAAKSYVDTSIGAALEASY